MAWPRVLGTLVLVAGGAIVVAIFVLGRLLAPRVEPDPERIAALEAEIDSLQAAFQERLGSDSLLAWVEEERGEALLGLRTGLLQEFAGWAARAYLDDVRLHVAPDEMVEEEDEVGADVGPIRVPAGRWRVRVTILRVEATLGADTIALAAEDSLRMSATVAVAVSGASGDVRIDFWWDAAGVAGVVCRDFEIHERFGGVVPPFIYRISGTFRFEPTPDGILAVPEFERPRMRVRPRATAESWRRVNALLDRQNHIFRCGLALQPDDIVEKLERLLAGGFEFRLPEILFRPVRLPVRIADHVRIGEDEIEVRTEPVHFHLTADAIWFGSDLHVGGRTESADAVPVGRRGGPP